MKYAVWGAPGAGALLAFDVTGGNRIDWYAGPMLAELLGVPERVAA
jgi:hypothetical protein